MIDLGTWAQEKFRIPVPPSSPEEFELLLRDSTEDEKTD